MYGAVGEAWKGKVVDAGTPYMASLGVGRVQEDKCGSEEGMTLG